MRLTDEAVCGLAVEDPAVASEPARVDGSLDATHEVLFVDCADKGKGAPGQPALPAYGVQKVARCKKGAGKATLHVAGPSAIELSVPGLAAKGVCAFIPAGTFLYGVHMAEEREIRCAPLVSVSFCRDEEADASSAWQSFELFDRDCAGKRACAVSRFEHPAMHEALD